MVYSPVFLTPPPVIDFNDEVLLTFPQPHILLLTLNRPAKLNTFFTDLSAKLTRYLDWVELEPEIWCVVVTGNGRAFSCGGDLEAWLKATQEGKGGISGSKDNVMSKSGAAGMSRRVGTTVFVAAVNGLAFGGGMEIVTNCDLVVASEKASFCLPETKRGLYASQGALPRLMHTLGRQRASEIALLATPITAQHGYHLGFVNKVVKHDELMDKAMEWAIEVCKGSPQAIALTKRALGAALSGRGLEDAVDDVNDSPESIELSAGDNVKEGMMSFVERRAPIWTNPKGKL